MLAELAPRNSYDATMPSPREPSPRRTPREMMRRMSGSLRGTFSSSPRRDHTKPPTIAQQEAEIEAATKMQARFRGTKARNPRFGRSATTGSVKGSSEVEAATKLQALHRGKKSREATKSLRRALQELNARRGRGGPGREGGWEVIQRVKVRMD